MMIKIVVPTQIGRITIIGPLLMLMVAQSSVGAESLLWRSNDQIMKRGENQERSRFSSSSDSFVDEFNLQQDQWRMDYSLVGNNWSRGTDMRSPTRALNQGETIETSQLSSSTINGNMGKILEATNLESPGSGRSFTVLHMFLKSLKNTLKALRPEIKFSECAQKYFFSDTSSKPTHDHDKKKKKKRKKHKHDPEKDYSDHITDGVVSSVFSLHSGLADAIYEEYRPYLHVARSVYRNVKSTFEIVRQDPLMKCTVDYLVARFCIWVDG